eukprot:3031404-Lingulodinium_polyedra.AAC.1
MVPGPVCRWVSSWSPSSSSSPPTSPPKMTRAASPCGGCRQACIILANRACICTVTSWASRFAYVLRVTVNASARHGVSKSVKDV